MLRIPRTGSALAAQARASLGRAFLHPRFLIARSENGGLRHEQ